MLSINSAGAMVHSIEPIIPPWARVGKEETPGRKIRNPQHEIRNKFKIPITNDLNQAVSSLSILDFEFVSDFVLRISYFASLNTLSLAG